MRHRNAQSGTALLETMMALLVMALMATALATTLGSGVRVFARSGVLSEELALALARRDLRYWLDHAMNAPVPGDARPLFVGRSDGFDALTLPPDGPFWPGWATGLTLAPDGELLARGQDPSGNSQIMQLRIAPEGQWISVRYWGRMHLDHSPGWRADWPTSDILPILVQIRFLGPGRALPPLTLRPTRAVLQSEMSLSSLLPPALPSRP